MSANLKANELSNLIIQSNEFNLLLQAKQVIDKNNAYQNNLKTLKSKEVELHKIMMPDVSRGKTKADELKNYYNEIVQNQDIKRYLDAEKRFNEYVSGLLKIVNDNIEKRMR